MPKRVQDPGIFSQQLKLLDHFSVAAEEYECFRLVFQFAQQVDQLRRVDRSLQIEVEHELEVAARYRP